MKTGRQALIAVSDSRVEIGGVLGRGRGSVTYHAFDRERQEPVTIKIAHRPVATGRYSLDFRHPHVLPVYFHDRDERRGLEKTVRPLIEGTNLEKLITNLRPLGVRDRERLSGKELLTFIGHSALSLHQQEAKAFEQLNFPQAVALMGFQLAGALAAAHGEGLIHQNLKPTNILLDLEGRPHLTDFHTPHGLFPAVASIYEKADRFSLISLLWDLADGRILRADSMSTLLRTEPKGSLSEKLLRFLHPEYFREGSGAELQESMLDFLEAHAPVTLPSGETALAR